MKFSQLIIGLVLIGCKPSNDSHSDSGEVSQNSRTEEKVFGDSLKIIYEYFGDTVIQNRIDLKGTTDDDFDNSFIVTSTDAIRKVDNDINESLDDLGTLDRLNPIKVELKKIKNGALDSLSTERSYLTFDLLRTIDFSVYDRKTKSNLSKVRVEQYETNFS